MEDTLARALGIIGTTTGTLAFGWGVFTWLRDRRTRLTVSVSGVVIPSLPGGHRQLWFSIVNHSAHPITVKSATVKKRDGEELLVLPNLHPPNGLPTVIAARDAYLALTNILGDERSVPVRLELETAAGETFSGGWFELPS